MGLTRDSLDIYPIRARSFSMEREEPEKTASQIFKVPTLTLILNVLCFLGFAYSLTRLGIYFFNDPQASRISTVYPSDLFLPEILICTPMPLNVSALLHVNYTQAEITQLYWPFTLDSYKALGIDRPEIIHATEPSENLDKAYMDWGNFVLNYGPICENVLVHCRSGLRSKLNCCESARKVIHEKHGTCFLFERLKQIGTGFNNGFTVMARFAGLKEHLGIIPGLPLTNGLVVEMAQDHEAPRSWHANEQILIAPNSETRISVTPTYQYRQQRKATPCEDSKKPLDFSRTQCIDSYYSQIVERVCNCSLLGYVEMWQNTSICYPKQLHDCDKKHDMFAVEIEELWKSGICIVPCKQIVYKHRVSVTPLELPAINLALGSTNGAGNESYFLISVFYQSLSYQLVREFGVLDFDMALSNLGGILGLYFGASLIGMALGARNAVLWLMQGRNNKP